ncbi:unnamed protein product [Schistosoma rodhaini]|uniref:Phosphatidylserine synthase n=1 Tax=Schistosoma rodhaini TaxID=6188 RepID=A0AA85F0R7_9TREM|nr:unnamed protein product [Schistosoma rodhaini]
MKKSCRSDDLHGKYLEKNNKQNNIQSTFTYSGHHQTAYNWEDVKNRTKEFYDDGTSTFFWNAHTVLCLFIFACILIYVALLENGNYSSEYNMKRGISAVIMVFLLFGVLHTPDGPFLRPHPAFWRFILCLSILYELILVFLLFQSVDDARQWLRYLDLELGKPLEEKDYGGNCRIYDWDRPDNPWHNVISKMDGFVTVHFVGWWAKTLILRDYWICNVLSFAFEVLEYSLEHQLPNFSECWWDHWIMDFLGCNLLGIWLGMKTINYLSMKPYHWRGMWNIPSYRGKLRRVMLQFTPRRWTDFDWRPTGSLKRWLGTLVLAIAILTAELNTFYLKFVLWVPPPHFLCLGRLIFLTLMGATAIREYFEYLDDPKCKRFGRQAWMIASIIITELLIVMKFGWDIITKPFPRHISIFWSLVLIGLVSWTFWHFYIVPWLFRWGRASKTETREEETIQNHRLQKAENHVAYRRNARSSVKLLNHS